MLKLSPVVRLSLGLTLLTVSLLLLSDMLGLMPNTQRAELQTRKVLTELLAVQVSDNIEKGNLDVVRQQFDAVRQSYSEIASLGLRLQDESLLFVSGEHVANWQSFLETRSTSKYVQVPIYRGGSKWADLEVAFSTRASTLLGFLTSQKTAAIVLLIGFFGFFINWLFLRRALSELDPSSVVPERVSAAFNVLAEGLVMLDRSGRIVLCNTAFEEKTCLNSDQLIGLHLSELDWISVDTDVQSDNKRFPWITLLETGVAEHASQVTLKTVAGDSFRFAVNTTTITTPDGVIRGAVVTFDDVTELAKKHSELERLVDELKFSQREISRKNRELEILATRDPLTGSLNRRSLFELMEALQTENRESGRLLSCIMVDIDHFKSINDNYGHAVGDDVIVMLSKIMHDVAESDCLVGRYGGEEFVVALPGYSEEDAAVVAENMRTTLCGGSYYLKSMPQKISASFGVSTDSEGLMSPGELVDLADKGLYVAKETGRNQVVRYSMRETLSAVTEETLLEADVLVSEHHRSNSESELESLPDSSTLQACESPTVIHSDVSQGAVSLEAIGTELVLLDRIAQGIGRSKRQKTHVVVMHIELDIPDPIDNTAGSNESDNLLEYVSDRLKKMLRATDTVEVSKPITQDSIKPSRLGAADIVIVLSDVVDALSATWIVRRIREEMKLPFLIEHINVSFPLKMGISIFPGDGEEPTSLVANAEQALLEARKSEKCITYYFDREINELADKTHRLESELNLALERDEFSLVYQPIIELDTGRVVGFEVLIRWKNVLLGLVSPAQFIPVAEQSGAIDAIGRWIFEKAAYQLKLWHTAGFKELYLSINVSAMQFRTPEFLNHVRTTVDNAGLPHKHITVEFTEKSLINDLDYTANIIDQLHEAGFKIALDDFGTGYSSLVYLKNYSFDTVKIDRSFFVEFPANARDTSLIKAIISLSRSLGLTIVAEGVETLLQLDVLMTLHCDEVQGYVFSEPLSREQAMTLLQNPDAIVQKVNSLRGDTNKWINNKHSAISGVLNEIGPLDITALSNAANQVRKVRALPDRGS